MTLIAEPDHQLSPQAIAEILRQELYRLDLSDVTVDAEIVDSNLDLQIRSNSAIDKEKLLTLVRSGLQSLQIESLAKFRIHCWRGSEIAEPRLLWSEQFMLQPLEMPENLATDVNSSRSPEPQLSKNSVLQAAISQIANNNPKMQQQLVALQQQEKISNSDRHASSLIASHSIETKPNPNLQTGNKNAKPSSDIDHSYWHLVLAGLFIVLVGLGIGAVVRALTIRNAAIGDTKVAPISVAKPPQANETPTLPTSPTPSSPMPLAAENPVSPMVTLSKFNLVENGMTIEQVEKIFGVTGKVIAETSSGESVGKVYSWRNPEGSNAIIEFKNGQVVAKAQAGL